MTKKITSPERTAAFIESMECLPVSTVPEGPEWPYEIKLDGYRLEVVRNAGQTTLFSRRENVLNKKFGFIADALDYLPGGTVIDGELVALDASGRPNFNLLQNFRSAESQIRYFAFDILVHKNRDLTRLPLSERRKILRSVVEPADHIDLSEESDRTAADMLQFVREHGLERYRCQARRWNLSARTPHRLMVEASHQFGPGVCAWRIRTKQSRPRLSRRRLLPGKDFIYASRVRAGFIPATRRQLFEQIKHLTTTRCPFANLPEVAAGRWGQGLTAEKMRECVWLKPEVLAQIEFLEWTGADHLRHTKFIAMRDDKDPKKVVRET